MAKPRSRSMEKNVLPPVPRVTERLESLQKIYGKPGKKRGSSGSRPSTSKDSMHRSPMLNGRLKVVYSSVSNDQDTRSIASGADRYGRSDINEQIDDLRQELLQAKKATSQLSQENKMLRTKMLRLTRESERREVHLRSLVSESFQPAEVKDTHLAMTMIDLQRRNVENEELIRMQAEQIEELQSQPSTRPNTVSNNNNYNEEVARLDRKIEKNKSKIELAKQYVEQNKKLKVRLKELTESLIELKKAKAEEQSRRKKVPAEMRDLFDKEQNHLVKRIASLEKEKLKAQSKERELYEELTVLRAQHKALTEPNNHDDEHKKTVTMNTRKNSMALADYEIDRSRTLEEQMKQANDFIRSLLTDNEELRDEIERLRNTSPFHKGIIDVHKTPGFFGRSMEETDISFSDTSPRPSNVPPLDMGEMSSVSPFEDSHPEPAKVPYPINSVDSPDGFFENESDAVAHGVSELLRSHLARLKFLENKT